MSREDPQFKLRMPAELRLQAEQAAKAAGRSLNAELVARIQASLLTDTESGTLMPAKQARELALIRRATIPQEIRRRAVSAISHAVRSGHSEAIVSLEELNLDTGIPNDELEELLYSVIRELEAAGYKVRCEDIEAMFIEF